MEAFDYIRPTSLAEACDALREGGGEAMPLAGGTDLLVQMKQGDRRPATLVSLRDVPELRYVRLADDGSLAIGAATTLSDVENASELRKSFPAIAEAASWIGSVQVRDRGTIGGNLCNGAPSADTASILIAYGASASISDGRGERTVPLEEFFTGPGETVLESGELLTAVTVPPAPARSFGKYYKTFRSAMDCCTVGVAALVAFADDMATIDDARVVLGAIAPTPIRAPRCEQMLIGHSLDDDLIARVGTEAAAESRPIDDVRASAEYRRVLAEVLTKRALAAAQAWAGNGAQA